MSDERPLPLQVSETFFALAARLLGSARREWPILLTLVLAAGAFWLFIALADEVVEGETAAIDRAILLMLRDPSDPLLMAGPGWFQEMMRDFTGLGGFGILLLATLSATGFLLLEGKWHAAVFLVLRGRWRHPDQHAPQDGLRPATPGPRAAWVDRLHSQLSERAFDAVGGSLSDHRGP